MVIHVLPGDSIANEFAEASIGGEAIVCRECLVVGPLDGATLDEFWQTRSNFIDLEYGGDPLEYRENVAYELERLTELETGDEAALWFEHDLFCQANLWFCLSLLKDRPASVYRVSPVNVDPGDVWDGFGKHTAEDLANCWDRRLELTPEDRSIGERLWDAFRRRDAGELLRLGEYRSPAFPFLREACEAAAQVDTLPASIVSELMASGSTDLETLFPEFRKRAGVYGFGDLQVARLMDADP